MEFTVAQVQKATGAQLLGNSRHMGSAETRVRGWSIDSRTVNEGDLFFAIKGEHFDGHSFLGVAFERGASAAVVSTTAANAFGPLLEVADTIDALQRLARWAREEWNRPLVAVTGSAGKTTTKDIIADFLSVRLRVAKTIGNLNNHIGLPLSLLRIPADAEAGVFEMGMNHAGEIRHLACIAQPQFGVITNVGYAHVESFDSIDGVAAAKRELIEALPADGVAILNADDARVLRFRDVHRGRTITYGISRAADILAEEVSIGASSSAFTVRGVRFETRLTGRHAVSNILAGLAVATLFDIAPSELVNNVAQLAPGKMRGERHEWRGATVLDDCYNSNPEAARSMIDVLKAEPARRRIAVLGEMLELGHMAEALHRDLGRHAADSGVDVLIGVQGVSRLMVEEARRAGLDNHAAMFFEDPESAGEFLRDFARPGDAILFKGSRGTHVERALATMEI
ncbi:MAG: UDP-N-acetylmuramoyl-tripeptide--D-alanyl-D-alanine ligase [Acidobacteriaceae bacterium]|nr:UDP-N-acetylmuramoyl-tripeptide--D-alanyl-D-alanine ligase [Acidobacteriaceae bacterium]